MQLLISLLGRRYGHLCWLWCSDLLLGLYVVPLRLLSHVASESSAGVGTVPIVVGVS